MVKILLDKGGDINFVWKEKGEDGLAMIHRAAEAGNGKSFLILNHLKSS